MQTNIFGYGEGSWRSLPRSIAREATLSWRFIAGDVSASIVPAILFVMAASHNHGARPGEFLRYLGFGLLYFWLYIYIFCLANQLIGVEEDRRNKPYRPLADGSITPHAVMLRWCILMLCYTLLGWLLGVVHWAVLWQLSLVLYNFGGWGKRWYTKNFVMGIGVVAMLAAAWEIVQPLTPLAMQWIIVLGFVVFVLVSIQDLRDIDGDLVEGRRTFPIVFGQTITRRIMALCFGALPLVVHYWLMNPVASTPYTLVWEGLLGVLSWTIAVRLILFRSRLADHHTYLLLTYWYCLALLSAVTVL